MGDWSGSHFTSSKPYYDSSTGTFHNGSGSFDAYYNADTGTLQLLDYSGGPIVIKGPVGKTIKIALRDECVINTTWQFGIFAEGQNIIITADENDPASLTIKGEYYWADGSGAAITNYWDGGNGQYIGITGGANVVIDYAAGGSAYEIRYHGDVYVSGSASLDANVRYGRYPDAGVGPSAAVYTKNDFNLQTTGTINLSAAARDDLLGSEAYALYYGDEFYWANSEVDSNGFNTKGPYYISFSSVGKNPVLCNKPLPDLTLEDHGFYDAAESSKYTVARQYRCADPYFMGPVFNGFYFPDPSFRDYVRRDYTDDYGFLDIEKVSNETTMYLTDFEFEDHEIYCEYDDAYSLKGLEFFGQLVELSWPFGHLKELDLSNKSMLEGVYVSGNDIDTITLSGCPNLEELLINDNKLSSINLKNVKKLRWFECEGNNLKAINISYLKALTEFRCGNNLLKTLDLSKNTNLEVLDCANEFLPDYYDQLEYPQEYTNYNSIKTLDVSNNTKLQCLWCYRNDMQSLDLGTNSNLSQLFCYSKNLGVLDIRNCPLLKNVIAEGTVDSQGQYYTEYRLTYTDILRVDGGDNIITKDPTSYARCTSTALNLEGRLDILFYVKLPSTSTSGWTAKVFFEDDNYTSPRYTVALKTSNSSIWDSSKQRFTIICPNIEAKQMTQRAMLKIYNKSGKQVMILYSGEYGPDVMYAAADWANYMIDNNNARNKDLAKALLNYGQAAQEYFSYNTGRPAIASGSALATEMESKMSAVKKDSKYDIELLPSASAASNVSYTGLRLNLVGDTELMVMFKSSTPIIKYGSDTVALKKYSDTRWYASISNIASQNLGKKYTLNITKGSNTATIKVCALSWANLILSDSSSSAKSIKLSKALYLFYQEAYKYFNQ